jgi:hypothetical protein
MENVTSGDVLKSSSWNDMVDNIEYLKEQISNA